MMHAGRYLEADTERQVVAAQDVMVPRLLRLGVDVVVDDTNLTPAALERMTGHAMDAGVDLRIRSFLNVRLEVCLERNRNRPRQVPEDVIYAMYREHVQPVLAGRS
jgi:predicted kinase